jgi:hypothetical protein
MLKPPGTKRLKPKYDEPLSSLTFNFNLRRYSKALDLSDDDLIFVNLKPPPPR